MENTPSGSAGGEPQTLIVTPTPQTGPQKLADCAHRASPATISKKRMIVCCDGTWNNSNQMGGIPTNVSRLSAGIAHKCCTGMPQIVYYHRGAGTEESKVAKYLGGVLGKGVIQDIADCYRFICDNYNPGDEIIIVGFSRGAFTARSVAGLVCNLGLLNRVGLAEFGSIFHDYQHFANWTRYTVFHEESHLKCLTLGNYERLERQGKDKIGNAERRDIAALEADLKKEKKAFFKNLTKVEGKTLSDQTRLRNMAKVYRDMLEKHQMIACERQPQDIAGEEVMRWVPINVKVKAVGVWDTVGSLGLPKMPWEKIRADRSAQELRFASLDVHPNVENAFHALALDEWRTAFKPTLWGRRDNSTTNLRQVWFPGSHSNVGGGFKDQQIATIALAWMADQLTSLGVEFSTPEMKRIFYTVDPGVEARVWGMGQICSPAVSTSVPDRLWNAAWLPLQRIRGKNTILGTRTPNMYLEDDKKTPIQDTNELIHPSVRIRYLYDGKGLDDSGTWECVALSKNEYTLERSIHPLSVEDSGPQEPIASTYETLSGTVCSVHGDHKQLSNTANHTLVLHQQPYESELFKLDPAQKKWVWKAGGVELSEERIGMWERLFININIQLIARQEEDRKAREKAKQQQQQVEDKRLLIFKALDKFQSLRGAAGKVLNNTVRNVFNKTVGRVIYSPPNKRKPEGYPDKFGYHDFVSWQKGDSTTPPTRTW